MARSYSTKPTTLVPASLDDEALLAIGRLIRACAEIEDTVNLFICGLAPVSESAMVVMLGQTPISKRIDIAKYLAAMRPDDASKIAKATFNEDFHTVFKCRNAVAHGVLLGKSEDDDWAFLTSITQPPQNGSAIQEAITYNTASIQEFANAAEKSIPQLESLLKIQEQRQARYGRPLDPHRKGQPQRSKIPKPAPPLRSSRE